MKSLNLISNQALTNRNLAQTSAEQISLAIANVRMRDQLQDQSIRDPLTGLFNRRHFTERLRKFITDLERNKEPVSIVSIDVDHFKKFNDNHGHDAGDMVLRAVGTAMNQSCDGDEIACRMGGEEFMLLLPQTKPRDAVQRAEKLRRSVENIIVRYGEKNLPRITISAGIAGAPDHGMLAQDIIKIADEALYSAKAAGRNQVILASSEREDEHEVFEETGESKTSARDMDSALDILIVEANEVDQIVYKQSLKDTGLGIHVVDNSADALEHIAMHSPRLVVINMALSEMENHRLIKSIRDSDAGTSGQIYLLGITTHVEENDMLLAETGIDELICKPVSKAKLQQKVLSLLDNEDQEEKAG